MSLLSIENVTKGFNERVLLRGVALVEPGRRGSARTEQGAETTLRASSRH
jgi:hypothetical protein